MAHIRNSAVYIPYPGDHVERLPDIKNNLGEPNCLTICRIEPENNCHILIEAFSKLNFGHYTFIGNWNSSDYGRRLREKYAYVKNLEMCDPIYDKLKLAELREQCTCYLHGHSVGGTNPSLVEMLFYDANIFAYDCDFNRETARDSAFYFSEAAQLTQLLQETNQVRKFDRASVRKFYTRERIAEAYIHLF